MQPSPFAVFSSWPPRRERGVHLWSLCVTEVHAQVRSGRLLARSCRKVSSVALLADGCRPCVCVRETEADAMSQKGGDQKSGWPQISPHLSRSPTLRGTSKLTWPSLADDGSTPPRDSTPENFQISSGTFLLAQLKQPKSTHLDKHWPTSNSLAPSANGPSSPFNYMAKQHREGNLRPPGGPNLI